jgi:hypothetical protein
MLSTIKKNMPAIKAIPTTMAVVIVVSFWVGQVTFLISPRVSCRNFIKLAMAAPYRL